MVYGGLKICLIIYIAVSNNLIMFDTGLHTSNELNSSSKEVRNLRVHIHCDLHFPYVLRSLPIEVLPPYKKKKLFVWIVFRLQEILYCGGFV